MSRRIALVTGSGRGIGKAVLQRLAYDHDCVVHGRRDSEAAEAVAESAASFGAKTLVVTADLSEPDQVAALAERTLDTFGRLDTLVANAAATAFRPLTDVAGRHSRLTFATVIDSLVELVNRFTPVFGEAGRIVAIGGLDARFAQPGHGLLGGAKAALEALVRSWAVELGPRGVTANVVIPGPVPTDSLTTYLRDQQEAMRLLVDQTPMGRLVTVEDIAALIGFLVSPTAAMITGQAIVADGGISAHGGPWASMPTAD